MRQQNKILKVIFYLCDRFETTSLFPTSYWK